MLARLDDVESLTRKVATNSQDAKAAAGVAVACQSALEQAAAGGLGLELRQVAWRGSSRLLSPGVRRLPNNASIDMAQDRS